MADKIVEMGPRTVDIAAVQIPQEDQLMAKIATLEGQIASLKLQKRKVRSSSPLITIRGVEVAANQGAATILRDDIASTIPIQRSVSPGKCVQPCSFNEPGKRIPAVDAAASPCCRYFRPQIPVICQGTEKPDVNSLWIVEQTSRSSLDKNESTVWTDFVFPYLDDVLVASSTEEEHSEHLKMVFERFQQYGLRINVSKSVMGAAQVEYLGFLITAEGSSAIARKVQAIFNYKLPGNYS
ncbi:retrovirus-related Pol polyprotein from transposon opus [Trichonephila clavipes]|nr:retrovirus-related Pol polyprotein from transposon opus [Trichonephila clavipes]